MATETATVPSDASPSHDVGGKYLTFELAGEDYGLGILTVREILKIMEITSVPRMPSYVKGVVNLRGKVIPVVDLRSKFGIEAVEATDETCIIVVVVGGVETGIVVDRVLEVLDIASDDIDPPPSFGAAVGSDFILGMGRRGEGVTILLDISTVLQERELVPVLTAAQQTPAAKESGAAVDLT